MRKLLSAGSLAATAALAVCNTTAPTGAQGQGTLVIQGGTLDRRQWRSAAGERRRRHCGQPHHGGGRGRRGAGAGRRASHQCRRQMAHAGPDRRQGQLELDVWRGLPALGRHLRHGDGRAQRPGHRRARCRRSRDFPRPPALPGLHQSAGRRTGRQAAATPTSPAPAIASFARPRKRVRWFATTSNRGPTSSAPMTAMGRRKSSPLSRTKPTRPAKAW